MARKKEEEKPATEAPRTYPESITSAQLLAKKPQFVKFRIWLVGETPLITHAWSHKAKLEMLNKQLKKPKVGKDARDPNQDFVDSLYEMEPNSGIYGFPVTGFKNAILSSAHKDKGIPRTDVMQGLYLHAQMVRTRPALAGAICDMPLVRIYGSKPEMREDMVRIGAGLTKTASLAYRAQFSTWAVRIAGVFNPTILTDEQLGFLIQEAGRAFGVGEWRNEKKGIFGAFHLGIEEEEKEWDAFALGKGPLPEPRVLLAA